jgi:hypothetical protein
MRDLHSRASLSKRTIFTIQGAHNAFVKYGKDRDKPLQGIIGSGQTYFNLAFIVILYFEFSV